MMTHVRCDADVAVRGVCGLKCLCKKKDMSATEGATLAAAEKEEQKEIFYAIMAATFHTLKRYDTLFFSIPNKGMVCVTQ